MKVFTNFSPLPLSTYKKNTHNLNYVGVIEPNDRQEDRQSNAHQRTNITDF